MLSKISLNVLSISILMFILSLSTIASVEAKCCRVNNVHPEFSCPSLDTVSEGRCNAVWSGGVVGAGPCKWYNGNICPMLPPVAACCVRVNTSHPEFNCSYWTSFGDPVGKNRCNAAWTGGIPGTGPCKWVTGIRCLIRPISTLPADDNMSTIDN
ncbi:MAG: hypothetical protein HQK51_08575 [Oligoflexia bacterium]|nr:hypothetical protein [Oligoflexia bacterium]